VLAELASAAPEDSEQLSLDVAATSQETLFPESSAPRRPCRTCGRLRARPAGEHGNTERADEGTSAIAPFVNRVGRQPDERIRTTDPFITGDMSTAKVSVARNRIEFLTEIRARRRF
jgi:hypothetical protein